MACLVDGTFWTSSYSGAAAWSGTKFDLCDFLYFIVKCQIKIPKTQPMTKNTAEQMTAVSATEASHDSSVVPNILT